MTTPTGTFLHGGHVRANGIRQHYLRYGGKGEPLVVIPGITSPAITWGFVGEHLGRRWDTFVLDTRGRGLSESGPHLDYSLDAYAADAAGFVEAMKFGSYRFVGHSMGARIGARLGHLHGAAISRLALIDPPLSGPGRRPYVKDLSFYLDAIHEARAGLADVESVRRTYPRWTDEQLRTRAEWLHTCDDTAIEKSLAGLNGEEVHGDFPHLKMPTLLMVAANGGVINASDIAEVRALLPSIQVRRIEGSGHMIPFDDPQAFFSVLEEFLA